MPKVLCTLPNASEEIGGIKFTQHAKGMLSEDIGDDEAARLASIDGYTIVGGKDGSGTGGDGGGDDKDALLAKAKEIGLAVKGTWGVDRLKSEIEAAEKAKADTAN